MWFSFLSLFPLQVQKQCTIVHHHHSWHSAWELNAVEPDYGKHHGKILLLPEWKYYSKGSWNEINKQLRENITRYLKYSLSQGFDERECKPGETGTTMVSHSCKKIKWIWMEVNRNCHSIDRSFNKRITCEYVNSSGHSWITTKLAKWFKRQEYLNYSDLNKNESE